VPKHAGMTAFMIPMDLPGIEVRPIRQMSGGTSFNEVFLTEVRVPDSYRLGEVGQGWKVALTTLGFERQASSGNAHVGGSWAQLLALARWAGADTDPLVRQQLAKVVVGQRLAQLANVRDQHVREDSRPLGAVGSIRKMQWVRRMLAISDAAREILGPLLVVDTGQWGTYSWGSHVLGVPGYRIAGGSDEIQRNIIAERFLGLPAEPRDDRHKPWKDIPR
jgi:alkylation response protein AidB-like acyl-CoA dehydrogenase